jgi:hypothetical protein
MEKPTLAIWGAGGCNDIDIRRLSTIAKLVLVDCEKERTRKALERYGLDASQAVTADLFFYDIPYESYEHWEEMLAEGVTLEKLHAFLSELLLEAVSTDMLVLPEFDYSVAVGITSQLNSRLAALLYLYKENYSVAEREDILSHIAIMDRAAVGRLYEMVQKTTGKKTLWGYEEKIVETGEKLNIEGNNKLQELLQVKIKECESNLRSMELLWPFVENKSYNIEVFVKNH